MIGRPERHIQRHKHGQAMNDTFLMLGIESSCDETAAALVKSDGTILASEIASQMEVHAAHGGVVPEIAARAHLDAIDSVIGGDGKGRCDHG